MSREAHTRGEALRQSETAFGLILLENGWISEMDLTMATQHASAEQIDLAEAVVALRFIDEHDSYAVLSIAAGVEFIDLADAEMSPLAVQLIPPSLAYERLIVPLAVNNRVITFATCCPFLPDTKRELTLATGRQSRMFVAQRSAVLTALDRCYGSPQPSVGLDSRTGADADRRTTIAPTDSRPVRVLVTEDEPVTRVAVKVLLQKQRFEVLEAANGRQALEIVARTRPDVLLIDLNMPEMTGYEAIAQLRRHLHVTALPIVVLTSEEGRDIQERVLQLGANDYLVKPFDPEVLVSRVTAAVRRGQGTHAAARAWGS